jgi:type II secretory pathway component PulM
MADDITLEFLARQQSQILSEMSAMRAEMTEMRDDIRVLTAMAVRQDHRSQRTLDLLHQTIERVRTLEDSQ